MPPRCTPESRAVSGHIDTLTTALGAIQAKVLRRAGEFRGGKSLDVQSFHGTIGSKNNEYVDSVRTQFAGPEDFQARWFRGLVHHANEALERRRALPRAYGATTCDASAVRLARMMQDSLLRRYTLLFLERNFYRNLRARMRAKPTESLWRLWFGDNKMPWGLIIAPAYRANAWTNDVSEIRRANYQYWTVGHLMQTGLIDPEQRVPHRFTGIGDFFGFYRSVLKRCSNSQYEKAIADRYVDYLEESPDLSAEPFLVPELRYAGLKEKHEYRLDYAVLNPHTMTLTGFELSPHSTHGAVKGMAGKTQAEVNRALSAEWGDEMDKRNKYFQEYGITTVTFTDDHLRDIDSCFEQIADCLRRRGSAAPVLSQELEALDALDLDPARRGVI